MRGFYLNTKIREFGKLKFLCQALTLSFFLNSLDVIAQQDTLFWFAAPDIIAAGERDRPIFLRISAGVNGANVLIEQPANGAVFAPIVLNLAPNTTQSVDLTPRIDYVESKPANTILPYGIRIRSNEFISVYYEVFSNLSRNPDIFSLKGINALGTSFYIPNQTILNNDNLLDGIPVRGGFNIVATENNTQVTIIPRADIVGHLANTTINLTLNRGQTWSAVEASNLAANHLSGSRVTSDKPIAITTYDDFLIAATPNSGFTGGCKDLAGDQIVPINTLGNDYVIIRGGNNGLNGPDRAFIVTTEPNTQIFVDGAFHSTVADEGTTLEIQITQAQRRRYINSNKPIYVYHLSGFGCEVGGALIPPLLCNGSKVVTITRSVDTFMGINLIVRNGGQNFFTFNNIPITPAQLGQFDVILGTNNEWVAAQIEIPNTLIAAGQNLRVENTEKIFHLGVINGDATGSGCRYGYFSNFNKFISNPGSNSGANNPLCEGDTLILFSPNYPSTIYNWTGPNGVLPQLDTIVIPNVGFNDTGVYSLSINVEGCLSDTNQTEVVLRPLPPPPTNLSLNPNPVCRGEDAVLNAISDASNILWFTTPVGGIPFANVPSNVGVIVNHLNDITYYASSLSNLGCLNDARLPIDAQVIQPPDELANSLSSVCIFPEPNNFYSYSTELSEFVVSILDNGQFDIFNAVATVEAVHPAPITHNGVIYMQRVVSVTAPSQEPTIMRIYFTQQEFDNLVSAHGLLNNMQHLRVTKFPGEIAFPAGIGELMPVPTVIQNYNGMLNVHALEFEVTCCSSFFIHFLDTIINPLHINLSNFDAHCTGQEIIINWEISNYAFLQNIFLEKSIDGINYSTIYEQYVGDLVGNQYKFSYSDFSAQRDKNLHYRLIEERADGNKKIMGHKSVNCEIVCESICEISAHTNITDLIINFKSLQDQKVNIKVSAIDGKLLTDMNVQASEGQNQIYINKNWSNQIVIIKITDARNRHYLLKLMI